MPKRIVTITGSCPNLTANLVGTTAYDRGRHGANRIDGIKWRIADECDAETATVMMLNGEEKYFKGMDSRFEVAKGRDKPYDFNVLAGYEEMEFEYQIIADCNGDTAEVFCSNCGANNGQAARPRIRFEEIIADGSGFDASDEVVVAVLSVEDNAAAKGEAEGVNWQLSSLSDGRFETQTSEELRFEVKLPPGKYEITLKIGDGEPIAKTMTVGGLSFEGR